MAIKIRLDELLKARGITSKELAKEIDITEANLSILKSGKARAIRFSTLEKICTYLDCQPGDILTYES
ncbi:helix-turn-helix transcriptional regulator [Pantoea sp. 1.19]|uniref:helix-turn-helix domain-containing protein n=1 Tax=Pantoea sp. 1.19 TaxID=1925589 RepID=UPI000948A11C|nr:helix-turn-helix transcriptional regulator [Pantoea sp. 1.19]